MSVEALIRVPIPDGIAVAPSLPDVLPEVKLRRGFIGFVRRHPTVALGSALLILLVLVAIFAPWIATYDVGATDLSMRYLAPSAAHWFGTDSTGRDIFSRVVFGSRISLEVGIVVVVVSIVIGTVLGALAGY